MYFVAMILLLVIGAVSIARGHFFLIGACTFGAGICFHAGMIRLLPV